MISSLAFIALSVINLSKKLSYLSPKAATDAPVEDLPPPLPLLTPLEPRVPAHKFGKERMELVLRFEVQLKRIHERDERLSPSGRFLLS